MIHYTSSSYGFEKRIFTLPLPPSTSNFISKSAMLVNPVFNFNKRVQQKRNPQKPHTTLEINVHTSGTLNRDCPEGIPALSWATWRCSENGTRGCKFPRHGALLASDASLVEFYTQHNDASLSNLKMNINLNEKERLKKLIDCVSLEALREEYQIVKDRMKGSDSLKDDKKYASVLKIEIAEKILQNLTTEVDFAEREVDLTKRIANYKIMTKKMKESEKEDYVEDLKKDVEGYNKDVDDMNKKRSELSKIVKSELVVKPCKDVDKKWKNLQAEIVKKTELLSNCEKNTFLAEEGDNFVDIPFISAGSGFVDTIRNRIESTSSQPQNQVTVLKQLTLEEFREYHRKVSEDMSLIKYKGDITMADVEFYSYDRFLVFKTIWERARSDGIILSLEDETFGKDVNDVVFVWLVRGTNFERIKTGLSPKTQTRLETLIRRYGFKNRAVNQDTGAMVRLQNDELTVSRFCDIYPMKVWAVWTNSKLSERPDFITFTGLSKAEKESIRYFRCPSLPYFCSKTRSDGSKDISDFQNILIIHAIVLTDFDRLMFEWVKNRENMPDEFTPRIELIKKIIKKKALAEDLVPKDQDKFDILSKAGLIIGSNCHDMKENPTVINNVKDVLKKMLGAVLYGEEKVETSLDDLL